MEQEKIVLVLKDEEGNLRPQAGCWNDDLAGEINAQIYLSKPINVNCTVVKCKLTEIK